MDNKNKDFLKHVRDSQGNRIKDGSIVVIPNFYKKGDKVKCRVYWHESLGGFWAVGDLDNNGFTGFPESTARECTVIS